jgi:hypothetical protein
MDGHEVIAPDAFLLVIDLLGVQGLAPALHARHHTRDTSAR